MKKAAVGEKKKRVAGPKTKAPTVMSSLTSPEKIIGQGKKRGLLNGEEEAANDPGPNNGKATQKDNCKPQRQWGGLNPKKQSLNEGEGSRTGRPGHGWDMSNQKHGFNSGKSSTFGWGGRHAPKKRPKGGGMKNSHNQNVSGCRKDL